MVVVDVLVRELGGGGGGRQIIEPQLAISGENVNPMLLLLV